MKKVSLLFVALVLAFTIAQSQEKAASSGDAFSKGFNAINVGIGFGNTIYTGLGMGIPSISASYEIGIVEIPMGSAMKGVVGVGGIVGWDQMKDSWHWGFGGYDYDVTVSAIFVGVRGNYHFIFVDKLDLYAGILLGYYFGNYNYDWGSYTIPAGYNDYSINDFYPGAYVGARYFFKPNFAVYSEIGRNISIFSLGVTFGF